MNNILYICVSLATGTAGIIPSGPQLCSMWEKPVHTPQVWSHYV